MINIKKELKENQVILGVMESKNYNKALNMVPKLLASKGSVCYITTSKTSASLIELFKKKGVNLDNVIFVDAISKTFKQAPDQGDSVYFVSSPGALTELSLVISKFLKHNFDYIIFDSITNLMVYSKKPVVHRFLRTLVEKIKTTKTKSIFFALNIKEHAEMIKQCNMFFDKVIKCCD